MHSLPVPLCGPHAISLCCILSTQLQSRAARRKQLEIDYAKHIDGLHSLKRCGALHRRVTLQHHKSHMSLSQFLSLSQRYREETARKQYAQDLRILQNQSKVRISS